MPLLSLGCILYSYLTIYSPEVDGRTQLYKTSECGQTFNHDCAAYTVY